MNQAIQTLRGPLVPALAGGEAGGERCLHEVFEEQVDLRPDAPALECGELRLTYAELDEQANRLAHLLLAIGAGRGSYVGLCFNRSELPIVSILSCHKAGCAYVPLDPVHPDDRLQFITAEANIQLVLTESGMYPRVAGMFDGDIIAIDEWREYIDLQPSHRPGRQETGVMPWDVCYVLYTSGTTGRPKGVVAEHRNVAHFVAAFNKACQTTPADRIFQGFALGFDGSVEEIWMAFSNGATLITGKQETPRFGNELARFLAEARITYFSTVPTVLSTMSEDIPSLRQVVVSGEACPQELVARWARPGRVMLNVYGPTEATVNTTAAILQPDRPVTIGHAIEGYSTLILDSEMHPVPPGDKGELYVGGPSVSRGYLNQPELTDRSFIRLYRTGDLARVNDQGELEFFGRIDSQVKIRGYRVELSEIEAVLVEEPQIRSAAVILTECDGTPCLAAYVVLDEAAGALDRGLLLDKLRSRLPPYMVPAYLDILGALPMLSTGKTDRKRLPAPVSPLVAEDAVLSEPDTPLEARIAAVWSDLFKLDRIGVEQDFFLDLGGHSLMAAKLAAALRNDAAIAISVRDIYACPTVRQLARHVEKTGADRAETAGPAADDPETDRQAAPAVRHEPGLLTGLVQYGFLAALAFVLALPLVLVLPPIAAMLRGERPILEVFLFVILVALCLWPILILVGLAGKWLIIGRYRPGAYPLWGSYYLRWWTASWLQNLMGLPALAGTPLAPVLWRLMGARVGRDCILNADAPYAWDCISIGDDTSLSSDCHLPGIRVEGGHLLVGRVDIGSRCFVGAQTVVGLNARIGDDCIVGEQSLVPDGAAIAPSESCAGSPARPFAVGVPEGAPLRRPPAHLAAFATVQLACSILLGLAISLPFIGAAVAAMFLILNTPATIWVPAVLAGFLLFIPAACIYVAICKKLIDPFPRTGTFEVYSLRYLQYWLVSNLMRTIRVLALPIFTTIFLPPWMRLLGAKLGRYTEMATVWSMYPDTLSAGDGVFFADGCVIGPARIHLGRVVIASNHIGNASFVGNSALLPSGAAMGDNCLLGVLSTPGNPAFAMPDGTDWLGSPGFILPNRDKVGGFSETTTYRPTRKLYLQRGIIDALRILLPPVVLGVLTGAVFFALLALQEAYGIWAAYAAAPALTALGLFAAAGGVAALKWAVMGRFEPVIMPLWSGYVWRNELLNGAYESIMLPVVSVFSGTSLAAPLLRLLGCRIGRHCYIASALFSEFDLIEIGDHVALNEGSIVQNHLFEDRVMKSSHLRIGDGCSVGEMSVVLYDSVMEENSILGPMSLLMKGEIMERNSRRHGIPTL